jgi:hypothetical protein
MKRALGVVLAGVITLVTGEIAGAFQCPATIEKGQAAVYAYKKNTPAGPDKDAKVAELEGKLRNARDLHTAGQHADAVREANGVLQQLSSSK